MFAVEYDDGVDGPARVWLGHMDVPGLAMSRLESPGRKHILFNIVYVIIRVPFFLSQTYY